MNPFLQLDANDGDYKITATCKKAGKDFPPLGHFEHSLPKKSAKYFAVGSRQKGLSCFDFCSDGCRFRRLTKNVFWTGPILIPY
jgi:hypothetical protein